MSAHDGPCPCASFHDGGAIRLPWIDDHAIEGPPCPLEMMLAEEGRQAWWAPGRGWLDSGHDAVKNAQATCPLYASRSERVSGSGAVADRDRTARLVRRSASEVSCSDAEALFSWSAGTLALRQNGSTLKEVSQTHNPALTFDQARAAFATTGEAKAWAGLTQIEAEEFVREVGRRFLDSGVVQRRHQEAFGKLDHDATLVVKIAGGGSRGLSLPLHLVPALDADGSPVALGVRSGVAVSTDAFRPGARLSRVSRVLLVAEAEESGAVNLCVRHVRRLQLYLEHIGIRPVVVEPTNRNKFEDALGENWDIVYLSSHHEVDGRERRLQIGGDFVDVHRLDWACKPRLLFVDACSVFDQPGSDDEDVSLGALLFEQVRPSAMIGAFGLLSAGPKGYWARTRFAVRFFERLFVEGQRLGIALRDTRSESVNPGEPGYVWHNYALVGDPNMSFAVDPRGDDSHATYCQ